MQNLHLLAFLAESSAKKTQVSDDGA
jgi:hypothetical protein